MGAQLGPYACGAVAGTKERRSHPSKVQRLAGRLGALPALPAQLLWDIFWYLDPMALETR